MNYDTTSPQDITVINATAMSDGQAQLTALLTANASAPMAALTWSEGLALGSAAYTEEWKYDSTFTSLTTNTGTTTSSRAATNGTVSGLITETAFFFQTYSIDPVDFMRFIITNDGSTNYLNTIFDDTSTTYTTMGASYAVDSTCTMNTTGPVLCDMVFDVVIAAGYTNGSSVAEC